MSERERERERKRSAEYKAERMKRFQPFRTIFLVLRFTLPSERGLWLSLSLSLSLVAKYVESSRTSVQRRKRDRKKYTRHTPRGETSSFFSSEVIRERSLPSLCSVRTSDVLLHFFSLPLCTEEEKRMTWYIRAWNFRTIRSYSWPSIQVNTTYFP